MNIFSKDIYSDLIGCIKYVLFNQEYKLKNTTHINELLELSKMHDISNLFSNYVKLKKVDIDGNLKSALIKEEQLAIFRSINFDSELKILKEAFNKMQVDFIPLKGSIIRYLYPSINLRTSADIDILVHESDLSKVINVLTTEYGYTTDNVRNFHDIHLYSKGGIHLELHFSILENDENIDMLLSDVWNYVIDYNQFEKRMINEFFIFHVVSHLYHHFTKGGCGIRPIIDLKIITSKLDFDSSLVYELCNKCSIGKFYLELLNLIDYWFNDGKESSTIILLEDYIMRGGVYGTHKQSAAISTSKNGRFKALFLLIFPPYSTLVCRYPKLKGRKGLLFFYQIKRILTYIFCRHGNGSKTIAKNIVSMNTNEIDRVDTLLKLLEIDK